MFLDKSRHFALALSLSVLTAVAPVAADLLNPNDVQAARRPSAPRSSVSRAPVVRTPAPRPQTQPRTPATTAPGSTYGTPTTPQKPTTGYGTPSPNATAPRPAGFGPTPPAPSAPNPAGFGTSGATAPRPGAPVSSPAPAPSSGMNWGRMATGALVGGALGYGAAHMFGGPATAAPVPSQATPTEIVQPVPVQPAPIQQPYPGQQPAVDAGAVPAPVAAPAPVSPAVANLNLPADWKGNRRIDSFDEANRLLYFEVYRQAGTTLYANAPFQGAQLNLPQGFSAPVQPERSNMIEVGAVVPVESFGPSFPAWMEGNPQCMHEGQPFKGRPCVSLVSPEFRLMESDMYNLFPVIGSINAARAGTTYANLGNAWDIGFGSCPVHIDSQKRLMEPADATKGVIARTALYMEQAYPSFRLENGQHDLMQAWADSHPVTREECQRTKNIEAVQGNENMVVKPLCQKAGLWD